MDAKRKPGLVRPLPVLYACAGCREFGNAAPRVAQALDERGVAQAIWLGTAPPQVSGRYPIFTLDACDKGCALEWVYQRGRSVQRALALQPIERDAPELATARILDDLARD
jgi:uncharacterized metal-binding protein